MGDPDRCAAIAWIIPKNRPETFERKADIAERELAPGLGKTAGLGQRTGCPDLDFGVRGGAARSCEQQEKAKS
jgi:hypothetical protein